MANLLYQQIEMLSREKHIEPAVVISAIEDAWWFAARKFYKTEEDLRAKFNAESGQVDVFSVLTVVEEVADPKREISVGGCKKEKSERRSWHGNPDHQAHGRPGAHRGANRPSRYLQKVREAETRTPFTTEYHTSPHRANWSP